MKRLALLIVIALAAILAGGLLLLGREEPPGDTHPVTVPTVAKTIAAPPPEPPVADSLPRLLLDNPVVSLNPETKRLEAQLSLIISQPGKTVIEGSVRVSGAPVLDKSSQRFFLGSPAIDAVNLPDLPAGERAAIDHTLQSAVARFFQTRAVFAPMSRDTLTIAPLAVALEPMR